MSVTINKIVYWKKTDMLAQIMVFAWSVFMLYFSRFGIFYLMSLAPLQIVSCVMWSFYFGKNKSLKYGMGTFIRRAFFIAIIILFSGFYNPYYGLMLLILLASVGPILALLYFVITCIEYMYYKKHL